jgi:hypothetical protein
MELGTAHPLRLIFAISMVLDLQASHHAQWPPSMRRSDPDMKLLASLIKKTAAPRYSSGLLNLPNMFCFGHSVSLSGNFSKSWVTIAVTM